MPKKPAPSIPLFVVPGLSMAKMEFLPFIETLRKDGLEVHIFDNLLVGEGMRPIHAADLTLEDYANYQWEQIRGVVGDENPFHLFGLSMGAMISAFIANARSQQLKHLFLAATAVNSSKLPVVSQKIQKRSGRYVRLDELVTIMFGESSRTSKPEMISKYVRYRRRLGNFQTPSEFVMQFLHLIHFKGEFIFKKLQKHDIDTTIIQGAEDGLVDKEHVDELNAFLPRAEMTVLPKVGHMLHLEAPDSLCEIILNKVAPKRRTSSSAFRRK